tara:strand:+ start:546 stop:887 length:342 start_codon:yes stop_codon:yes gene_type:complete
MREKYIMKKLSEKKTEAMNALLEAIKKDYLSLGCEGVRAEMVEEFNETISYTIGKKYIKISTRSSVWGFVVNGIGDELFQDGDILKAASWAAPARNFPRGNVFKEYKVRWTGA